MTKRFCSGFLLAIVACVGVPKAAVLDTATIIDKNAEAAMALHNLCVSDAGPQAVQGCMDEARTLADIRSSAKTLIDKAGGAGDGGGQ